MSNHKRNTIIVTSKISEGIEAMELLIQEKEGEGYKTVGPVSAVTDSVANTIPSPNGAATIITEQHYMVTMKLQAPYIRIFGGELDGAVVSHQVALRLRGAGMIETPVNGYAFASAYGRSCDLEEWQHDLQYAETATKLEGGEE